MISAQVALASESFMPGQTPFLLASSEQTSIFTRLKFEPLPKDIRDVSVLRFAGIKTRGLFFKAGSCFRCTTIGNLGMRKQAIRCIRTHNNLEIISQPI